MQQGHEESLRANKHVNSQLIDDFVSNETVRRSGYGSKLLKWVIEEAKKAKCDQVHLDSGPQRFAVSNLGRRLRKLPIFELLSVCIRRHLLVAFSIFFIHLQAETFIHPHGYWYGSNVEEQHVFDPKLSQALVQFFLEESAISVVDFGCGLGNYVKELLNAGFSCEGYDGNPDTFALTDGVACCLDFSEPVNLEKKYDWVLSLEVGEHLPKCYESIFINNLDRHAIQGIVLSWALKGQGGHGHFNEQNNDYIKQKLYNLGYKSDEIAEQNLRKNSSAPWFRNTIMVFRRV